MAFALFNLSKDGKYVNNAMLRRPGYACPVDASAPSAGCCDSWPILPFSNGISGSAST
jgi:hypothetical protein